MTFCWRGIRVRIGFSFFFVLALFFYGDRTGTGLWMLSAVFCHEMGHLCAMGALGVPVQQLQMGAFGLRITPRGEMLRPGSAPLVYGAGPAANLLAAAALYLAAGGGYGLLLGSACQTAMGLFNLLPVQGLDGGNLLCCLAGGRREHPLCRAASAASLAALLAAGGWMLLWGSGNATLLITAGCLAGMALMG